MTPSYRNLSGLALIVGLLLIWQVMSWSEAVSPIYFPPPSKILTTFSFLIATGDFWRQIFVTVGRMLLGFALASFIAIPVGVLMGQHRWIVQLLGPLVEVLRPLPSAAVIPVCILMLGIDTSMKIAVVAFGCTWPILVNAVDAVRATNPVLLDSARLLGLTPFQTLTRIVAPMALPGIFSGLRISLAIALILTVTAEMVAGSDGLGYLIVDSQRGFGYDVMFSGILTLGIIGILLSKMFSMLEKRVLFWHYLRET